jgi:twitching motility protein PilT
MVTFERSLSNLIRQGIVSYEEAVVRSLYPKDVEAAPAWAGAGR